MYRRIFVLLSIGALACVAAISMSAAEVQQEHRLSLMQALQMALENNLDLATARIDPEIAAESLKVREADYASNFQSRLYSNAWKQESRLVFEAPGSGDGIGLTAGVQRLLSYGGSYTVGLEYSRRTGAAVILDPYFEGTLSLTYEMPLLRGFGKEVTTETLVLAQGGLKMSREELHSQTEAVLQLTENAYWLMVAYREAVDVALETLARANDLLELNRKKVEVGTLAPIEITQAQAQVAEQEEVVIVARTNLADAEDDLRQLLSIPHDDPLWDQQIVPTDDLVFQMVETDLDSAISKALETRPELRGLQIDLENKQLSQRTAKNWIRHGLDLKVDLIPQGNNKKLVPDNPGPDGIWGTLDDVFVNLASKADAISEIFEGENYYWQVQMTYSFPLGNKAAKANHRISTLNARKAELNIENQEQAIRVEVRKAVRAVESGVQRIRAAEANVFLQRKKLEAEEKKYDNGMSTSFEVLTFQTDLSDAERTKIVALAEYRVALVALEKSQGTLMEARNFSLSR